MQITTRHPIVLAIFGTILVSIGIVFSIFTFISSLLTVEICGLVLIGKGIFTLFKTLVNVKLFSDKTYRCNYIITSLCSSVFALLGGGVLIWFPILGEMIITLTFSMYLLLSGLTGYTYTLRIMNVSIELRRSLFNYFASFINIVLGLVILIDWPLDSLYILGLFIGIDLISLGLLWIFHALSL